MNPLPFIAAIWMAKRVEIEFLDFITLFFCCIVILHNEVTSHTLEIGEQEYVKRRERRWNVMSEMQGFQEAILTV